MDATLQALPHQMEDALHTQASLLANYDWHYGDLNPETGTLPVTFTAVPKEQTASVTTATLVCNGKSYPMEAQDTGSFTVTVEVPLLQSLAFQQVILAEGPQQRIEALDLQEAAGTEELDVYKRQPMRWKAEFISNGRKTSASPASGMPKRSPIPSSCLPPTSPASSTWATPWTCLLYTSRCV